MPQSVIEWINFKAKGQPALPIFTDRLENAIGDSPVDADQTYEPLVSKDNLPGVDIPETDHPVVDYDQTDEIPGVVQVPRCRSNQMLPLRLISKVLYLKKCLWWIQVPQSNLLHPSPSKQVMGFAYQQESQASRSNGM
jgi:hypothetical protein